MFQLKKLDDVIAIKTVIEPKRGLYIQNVHVYIYIYIYILNSDRVVAGFVRNSRLAFFLFKSNTVKDEH